MWGVTGIREESLLFQTLNVTMKKPAGWPSLEIMILLSAEIYKRVLSHQVGIFIFQTGTQCNGLKALPKVTGH